MPGCFAHLSVIKALVSPNNLRGLGFPAPLSRALVLRLPYAYLGAVSPDIPYLALASAWADAFHYVNTVKPIRAGLKLLFKSDFSSPAVQKQIAWLFGYATHVVSDLFVHPVIEKKVGPYKGHEREHRVCEMNEDVFILKELFGYDVRHCEFLDHTIKVCTATGFEGAALDSVLADFWKQILHQVYPDLPNPDPAAWYHDFTTLMDKFAENPDKYPLITRIILDAGDYGYPASPEPQYIDQLELPGGGSASYKEIFARNLNQCRSVWRQMAAVLGHRSTRSLTLHNGDLDTGMTLGKRSKSIFWSSRV